MNASALLAHAWVVTSAMFSFYQCYASGTDVSNVFQFLGWYLANIGSANPDANNIITGQGFAPIPGSLSPRSGWLGAVANLLTTDAPINQAGSGPCAGRVGD